MKPEKKIIREATHGVELKLCPSLRQFGFLITRRHRQRFSDERRRTCSPCSLLYHSVSCTPRTCDSLPWNKYDVTIGYSAGNGHTPELANLNDRIKLISNEEYSGICTTNQPSQISSQRPTQHSRGYTKLKDLLAYFNSKC